MSKVDLNEVEHHVLKHRLGEYGRLRSRIDDYREAYDQGRPLITDPEYDELLNELGVMEVELGINDPNSPTNTVGILAKSSFKTVKHPTPMLSLKNAFTANDLAAWYETLDPNAELIMQPKIDGLAVKLVYVDGVLIRGVLRGDGVEGEDVTENLIQVGMVQTSLGRYGGIAAPGMVEVTGEVFVTKANFKRINDELLAQGKELYSNPRNYAAGSLRLSNPHEVLHRKLSFEAYGCVIHEPDKYPGYNQELEWAAARGFRVVPSIPLSDEIPINDPLVWAETLIEKMELFQEANRYETDGVVIKVEQRYLRERMGSRSNSPRWAIAYKFPPKEHTSTLNGVEWQVGKSGAVTPVAVIDPIIIGGVEVSGPTLHNLAEIERLGVQIGDLVVVSRRGEVIPKIERIVHTVERVHQPIVPPTDCPACGTELIRQTHSLYCPNNSGCPDQLLNRLVHFASRDAMNIKGLGHAALLELCRKNLVGSYTSVYFLGKEDLRVAYPNSEVLVKKVLEAIQESRRRPFKKVLYAINIPGVGEGTAERLSRYYRSFEALIKEGTQQSLTGIEDIGPKTAEQILNYLQLNKKELLSFDKIITYVDEDLPQVQSQDLLGQTVVVSGSDFGGKDRKEMEALVKARGGVLAKKVTKKTSLFIAGSNPGPEKVKAAQELGILTVSYF